MQKSSPNTFSGKKKKKSCKSVLRHRIMGFHEHFARLDSYMSIPIIRHGFQNSTNLSLYILTGHLRRKKCRR